MSGKKPRGVHGAAGKDLPARLLAAQVAKLLNCTPEDVAVLVSAGKLRPLGRPNPNVVKFFSAVELIALLADREWLDVRMCLWRHCGASAMKC